MSTRAMIGYLSPKGNVTGIYSHWDGYPTGLGLNLIKFYSNVKRVIHLIDGGDVSQIDWEDGHASHYAFRSTWVHWNSLDKKWTYEKDRGGQDEPWQDVKPRLFKSMEEFLDESLVGKSMIAYTYIFDFSGGDSDHSQLSKGRWRCFKSDYNSDKIFELELNEKKLIKGRKTKTGDIKEKIVDTIDLRKVA